MFVAVRLNPNDGKRMLVVLSRDERPEYYLVASTCNDGEWFVHEEGSPAYESYLQVAISYARVLPPESLLDYSIFQSLLDALASGGVYNASGALGLVRSA